MTHLSHILNFGAIFLHVAVNYLLPSYLAGSLHPFSSLIAVVTTLIYIDTINAIYSQCLHYLEY